MAIAFSSRLQRALDEQEVRRVVNRGEIGRIVGAAEHAEVDAVLDDGAAHSRPRRDWQGPASALGDLAPR